MENEVKSRVQREIAWALKESGGSGSVAQGTPYIRSTVSSGV